MSAPTSVFGRFQFSDENAKSVRLARPMLLAARTTSRTAETPATWPASRGKCRLRAHRPLPSMIMATCLGRTVEAFGASAISFLAAGLSDLHDFLLFAVKHRVDFPYVRVGDLLQFVAVFMMLVLANFMVLFEPLQKVHSVAAHIAHCDSGRLSVFRGQLGKFLAPLLIKFG